MPRILSISRNPRLLAVRNDALALAGYSVACPRQPNEAILLVAKENFDGVVIGHSVEPEIRRALIPAIRNLQPHVPILFVYAPPDTGEPLAEVSVDITFGPMPLIEALQQRVPKRRSKTGFITAKPRDSSVAKPASLECSLLVAPSSLPATMPSNLPAHLLVYKAGQVWVAVCMGCKKFVAASPSAPNVRAAATIHTCREKSAKDVA